MKLKKRQKLLSLTNFYRKIRMIRFSRKNLPSNYNIRLYTRPSILSSIYKNFFKLGEKILSFLFKFREILDDMVDVFGMIQGFSNMFKKIVHSPMQRHLP